MSASRSRLNHFLAFYVLLQSVKKLEEFVGGVLMKRLMYLIALSAMAVLVFAAIAVAQSVPEDQVHSHDANEQVAGPAEATTPAESTTPAPNSTTTVDIRDHAFNPAQLNVAPGTTVTFVNNDTEPHTATADNGLFDTGVLEPGSSFDVFFDGSGTVPYHCELHPDMQGSIVVGPASEAGGAEGTNPPNQSVSVSP
jgi:plastocyanin